jgi:hypothetical protein
MRNLYRALPILMLFAFAPPAQAQGTDLRGSAEVAAEAAATETPPAETTAPAAAAVEALAAPAEGSEAGELSESSEIGAFVATLMAAITAGNAGQWSLMVAFIIFLLVGVWKKWIVKQEDGSGFVALEGKWNIGVAVAIGVVLAVGASLMAGPVTAASIIAALLAGGVNGLAAGGLYDAKQLVGKKAA